MTRLLIIPITGHAPLIPPPPHLTLFLTHTHSHTHTHDRSHAVFFGLIIERNSPNEGKGTTTMAHGLVILTFNMGRKDNTHTHKQKRKGTHTQYTGRYWAVTSWKQTSNKYQNKRNAKRRGRERTRGNLRKGCRRKQLTRPTMGGRE